MNSEIKQNCGESCGCSAAQDIKKDDKKNLAEIKSEPEKISLDPTHFGDWQVNCRAIDF